MLVPEKYQQFSFGEPSQATHSNKIFYF